jgi:thymidylate synthase
MDQITDANKAWVKDLEFVYQYGNHVSPRGMQVFESIAYQSIVSMKNPVIINDRRKLGYKFMAAEAAWILSGRNDVLTIAPYSKDIAKFSDDGATFFGAYGPKICDQIPYVVAALHNDINTRQAVMTTWRENPPATKDVPCTISLQFLVRHNLLHCVASMRSSDLWLGHPYDIVNFSAVSFAILLQLNNLQDDRVELGNLFLTCGSKHIYERNEADVKDVIDKYGLGGEFSTRGNEPYLTAAFVEARYDDANEFVQHLWDCANSERGMLTMFSGL